MHERVEISVAQFNGRHERAGLNGVRVLDPKAQIFRSIFRGTGCESMAAHQVCQVWAETPGTVCASNGVAVQASSRFEDMSSSRFFFILIRRLSLRADPGSKLFGVVHVNAQKHLRVLCPAVLCALTEK